VLRLDFPQLPDHLRDFCGAGIGWAELIRGLGKIGYDLFDRPQPSRIEVKGHICAAKVGREIEMRVRCLPTRYQAKTILVKTST